MRYGTFMRYGRAALGNPAMARGKLRLLIQRLIWRYSAPSRQPTLGVTLVPSQGLDAQLGELADHVAVLVIAREPSCAHIGLTVDTALSLLAHLTETDAAVTLYSGGQELRGSSHRTRTAVLDNGEVEILFQSADGAHNMLRIDLYEARGNRFWVSMNESNVSARAVHDLDFIEPGLTCASHGMTGPSVSETLATLPVDLVFTWVNAADPAWQAMRTQHEPDSPSATDNRASTRFKDNGELRYALRAAARFMPWARHVYVVSNCAPPHWLETDHPTLTWVDHADILPQDVLPTFNSHAIETALHKIPRLSEHFVYFNDDMIVGRPLDKSWFFNARGMTRAHMEPYGMVTDGVKPNAADYLNAARNGATLVCETFGFWPSQLHRHVPYALRRSHLEKIESRFAEDIHRTRASRFRSFTNISLASFLYHHIGMAEGHCWFENTDAIIIQSSNIRWREELARAARESFDVVCVNEGGREDANLAWGQAIAHFLEKKVPFKAPWERHDT